MKNSILYITFFILCFVLTSRSKSYEASSIDSQVIGDVISKNKNFYYFIDTTGKIKDTTRKNISVYHLEISLNDSPNNEFSSYIKKVKRNPDSIVIIVGENIYILERYSKWLSDYFSIDTYHLTSPDELNTLLQAL